MRSPAVPTPLRVHPVALTVGFLAAATALFALWWQRLPVDPAIYDRWWERDARQWPPAWGEFAGMWARHAGSLVLLALIEVACLLAGHRARRWVRTRTPADAWWEFLFSLGLGHGLAGTLTLGLGLAGLLSRGVVAAVLLAALALAGPPGRWRSLPRFASTPPDIAGRAARRVLAACCAVFAAGTLLTAFQPEWFYDSLVYHLAVPEQYLLEHKVCWLGHTFISNYPLLQEMRYTVFLALGDDIAPKLLHWADGLCAAGAAAALARPFLDATAGWLAAALFLSTPSLLFLQQVTMVELGLTWFVALATMAVVAGLGWLPGSRGRSTGFLLMAGWFLGFAQGVKYIGLNASGILLGTLLVVHRRAGLTWRRTIAAQALAIGWASLWTGTWLAKNFFFTGNPLYPFLHGWLGGLNWDATRQALWMADNTKYGTGHGSPAQWLMMPVMIATGAPGFGAISFNPFPLLLAPPLALIRSVPPAVRLCGSFATLYALLWATSSQQVRFLVPTLPQAAVAAAAVVTLAGAGTLLLRAALVAATGWILLVALHTGMVYHADSLVLVPWATGHMPRATLLTRALPYYEAVQAANAVMAPRRRLLFIGSDESLYCARPRICDSIYDFSTLGTLAARADSPAGLATLLLRRGVSHLLVQEKRCEEYMGYGLFDWGDRARTNALGLWSGWLRPVYSTHRVHLFALQTAPVPAAERKAGEPVWLLEPAVARRAAALSMRVEGLVAGADMGAALLASEELVRLAPRLGQAYAWRGIIHGTMNNVPDAIRDDERSIRLGFPGAATHYNLGVYLALRGALPEAHRRFQEAGAMDPGMADQARVYAGQVDALMRGAQPVRQSLK